MTAKHFYLDGAQRTFLLRGNMIDQKSMELPFSSLPTCSRSLKYPKQAMIAQCSLLVQQLQSLDGKVFRILTDPNFLHAGEPVHLGPRQRNAPHEPSDRA